jgi:hypothetical protein
MPKNKDWGGVIVDFSGCDETLERVFGTDDISPGILSRRLWTYIRTKGIKRQTRARKALGGVAPLPPPPPTPVDPIDDVRTFKWRATNGQVPTFQEMLRDVRAYEARMGVEVVLQESLPTSSTKDKGEPEPDDLHARLVAAMRGDVLIGATPLTETKLDETKRNATVVTVPENMHAKLAEAFGGPSVDIQENVYAKLARAFTSR